MTNPPPEGHARMEPKDGNQPKARGQETGLAAERVTSWWVEGGSLYARRIGRWVRIQVVSIRVWVEVPKTRLVKLVIV